MMTMTSLAIYRILKRKKRKEKIVTNTIGWINTFKRVAFSEDVEVFEDPDENKEESVSVDVMSLLSKLVD